MRQTISGLVAAIAVVTASAAPAMACGLFGGSCSPCGGAYVSPCAQTCVPTHRYSGCNSGCGGWVHERLPDPLQQYHHPSHRVQQYYYVNQGPTYTGPGAFAPYPTYQEGAVSYSYRVRPHFRSWRGRTGYQYSVRPSRRHERMMHEPMMRRYN